jgi:signal transduction protein with GAF and PtsI domain
MPNKSPTLNRFPLFGLFAHQAARHMGYDEDDARLLGFSTALLYAIFKAKSQSKKETPEKKKELPKDITEAKTKTLQFGGQEFQVIYGKGKKLKQTVVGHELHDAKEYDSQIKAKFPEGWYDRLAKAFAKYLKPHDSEELNKGSALFNLYKAWRDENKVGFNRVDLEKLMEWLGERTG